MSNSNSPYAPALESLFARYYKPLRAYAFRYVNHREASEDIVQDIFLELWARRESIRFDDPDAVKSYLFKSVYTRALYLLKTRPPNDPLEALDENALSSPVPGQEQSLFFGELKTEIAGCVETLPPQCRKIFLLSRGHELKNREIAARLGISIKAVEKQIGKALSVLRKHLRAKDLLLLAVLFLH
ncbi:MAG: RNA polymerase sigma-70 factor [Tannerella sp.]|jgi:RNA polymerase sigma-70 factor (ECF subfamily)|nr:RNA polymerase sigma-70 factor [Tannerella sp.]